MRRITSRRLVAFSSRDRVGCEHRLTPVFSSRPQASKGGVGTQGVEIVSVQVAAADSEAPRPDYVGDAVVDPGRIALILSPSKEGPRSAAPAARRSRGAAPPATAA